MSAENDVPLGEGGRSYYEHQFADRIRQVNKSARPVRNGTGPNWSGRAGGGGVALFVGLILVRIFIAASRSGSHTPSYTYTPPPQPRFDVEMQKRLNEIGIRGDQNDVFVPNGLFGPAGAGMNPQAEPRLDAADVPVLTGLCYRIQSEHLQSPRTPGGRICQLLHAGERQLLARASRAEALNEDERRDLIDALNEILAEADFFDGGSFRSVPLPADFVLRHQQLPAQDPGAVQEFNRLLLEHCYPKQIIPLRERPTLTPQAREAWQKRALADLQQARQQAKH
jgi:hypothetical protein